jgi:hypothetical protein
MKNLRSPLSLSLASASCFLLSAGVIRADSDPQEALPPLSLAAARSNFSDADLMGIGLAGLLLVLGMIAVKRRPNTQRN